MMKKFSQFVLMMDNFFSYSMVYIRHFCGYVQKGAPAEVAFTQPGIQEVEEAKEFIVRCRFRIQMIEQPSHPYLVTLLEIGDAEIVFGWEVIVKCVLRH